MRKDDLDDDVLAERMRRGERAPFEMLTSRYWAPVHRIARNLLPDPSQAHEVAQRAFMRVLLSPEWFPPDIPFKVSLYRLTIVLSDLERRPGRAAPGADSLLPQFDTSGRLIVTRGDWTALAGRPDLPQKIRQGLAHLENLDRVAFVLREVEQLSVAEAAEILGTSREELRARAHRACLSLSGFLGELAGAAESRSA